MEKILYVMVYSPITNEALFKVMIFDKSYELEKFVHDYDRQSILVRSVESIKLKLEVIL